jgi:hypothetical protein
MMEQLTEQHIQEMASKLKEEYKQVQKAYLEQRKLLDDDMVVSGKTVKQWKEELWIIVPIDALNPQLCMETNLAIMKAESIAFYEHAKAVMRAQILDKQASSAYYRAVDHIVTDFKGSDKRIPGAATLETMAEVASEVYKKVAIEGDNELKFWKNILDHLQFCKKIMEQAGFNIHSEIKSEGNGRYLETLGRNYGGKSNE